jgi:hypothetical protein
MAPAEARSMYGARPLGNPLSGMIDGLKWTMTPPTANPNRATAMDRDAKWYHISTEKIRVNVSSRSRTAKPVRKSASIIPHPTDALEIAAGEL